MNRWVALLRGVNVGGRNTLPMAAFREALQSLGYSDVATYIQSGNAVFRAEGDADAIRAAIAGAVEDGFGFRPHVFVLPAEALEEALARNPFAAEADANGTRVHLMFLEGDLPGTALRALNAAAERGSEARLEGRVLYLHTPGGFGRSALAVGAAKLKMPATARNARSAAAIADLLRSLAP